jgi:general secretion pathway protein B
LWAVGLAIQLGVNMLVLVWVLLRRPDPVAQAAPAAAAATTPPMAANTAPPGMVTVPATVTFNIPASSPPGVSMGSSPVHAEVSGHGSAPPQVDEPVLQDEEPAVPPDYDPRDYRPAITPEQAGAIAAARRNGALPTRDEVLAQGSALPDLRLDMHVYAESAADRFVFINMRKLREGDATAEGVRVDEITRNGVELSYHGKQFALAK